jgi:hypothetical protein
VHAGAALLACLIASAAAGVIIDSGDGAGNLDPPPDFPYWQNVEQRLGGTTVIHLGYGWVLTARHVGAGVVMFGGRRYDPDPDTITFFGDPDQPADLMLFRLSAQAPWPDVPPLPIARMRPRAGQEVLMIGNGRNRDTRVYATSDSGRDLVGWSWARQSSKRWGTNRVTAPSSEIEHEGTATQAFSTRFESLYDGGATAHEAQAALGDSGGAVFARANPYDPDSEWVLSGVMFTVHHPAGGPPNAALYGDLTHSVDLAAYRDEIIALVRPACSDEIDNDGDGLVDHPDDPDCESPSAEREALAAPAPPGSPWPWLVAGLAVAAGLASVVLTRGSRTPR